MRDDAAVMAKWAKVKNEQFLGYDPYYKDLREALMAMAERCSDPVLQE